jgi:hypothetical protein
MLELEDDWPGAQFSTKWWLAYDVQAQFSSLQELGTDDARLGSVLGSQWNKQEWNVLLRRYVSGG